MRRIQNLMEQWLFIGPDNRQEQVNLPHTWNAKDGHDQETDIAVNSAIERKIGFLRIYFSIDGVVHGHFQFIPVF